jgi:hypothetical protein
MGCGCVDKLRNGFAVAGAISSVVDHRGFSFL